MNFVINRLLYILIIGLSSLANVAFAVTDSTLLSPLTARPILGYVLAAGSIAVPWGNTSSYGLHMPTSGVQCGSGMTAVVEIGVLLASGFGTSINYLQVLANNPPGNTGRPFNLNYFPTYRSGEQGYYLYLTRAWVDSDTSGSNVNFSWTLLCIPSNNAAGYVTSNS